MPAELGDLSAELEQIIAGLASALGRAARVRPRHPSRGADPARPRTGRDDAGPGQPGPVELDLRLAGRLPEQVEVGAYYVVSEALANVAKHAAASGVAVGLTVSHGLLRVTVRDNGRGGAALSRGTGLVGLKDRVEALRGRLYLDSPAGGGTILRAEFPGC